MTWSAFRTSLEGPSAARGDAPVLRVREYALKRVLDATLAAVGLAVSTPLWLLVGAAIKLEDGGPILYTQHRWGQAKRPFRVFKFRSMVVDADRAFGAWQAGKNDPRITRVGRLLRRTSLDELPQLLNIFRGEMSWVGPRALPINERQVNETGHIPDEEIPGFDLRCAVRPGLTGVAQVFAPRDVPRRQKFRYDSFYIRRQSLLLDLRLIAISVWISCRLRWEDRGHKVGGAVRRRPRADALARAPRPAHEIHEVIGVAERSRT
jgi:lipopolysaccharide/colanic/teichoic acid biosynthesis glycosyltransferase